MTRAAILDRDGTIIADRDYISDPAEVALLPNAAPGLRRLAALGLRLVVVTNQSGIGRGCFDESQLAAVNNRMEELLRDEGIEIAGIWHCPHRPDDGCSCRKPNTGLVDQAAEALGFDSGQAVVIGDKASDIELGKRLGAATILVRTGDGAETVASGAAEHDRFAHDILDAADFVAGIIEQDRVRD